MNPPVLTGGVRLVTIACRAPSTTGGIVVAAARNWSFSSRKSDGLRESSSTAGALREDARLEREVNEKAAVEIKMKRKKTMAQMDEELRLAMEGRAGDGGESGLELEDGKAVAMKRGVRENMFRYI